MKYIVVAKSSGRILRRRVLDAAPDDIRPSAEVKELTDQVGAEVAQAIQDLERGQTITYVDGVLTVLSVTDSLKERPFNIQLRTILGALGRRPRAKFIDVIAPGYSMDDLQVVLDAVTDFDPTILQAPVQARAATVQADLVTVIQREITKRDIG